MNPVTTNMKIAILPGDGIGPEVTAQAVRVIDRLNEKHGAEITYEEAPFGGAAYDLHGSPLPESTLDLARNSDAILLGATVSYTHLTLPTIYSV